MPGFADLVAKAQPALYGNGVAGKATEGRTWKWKWIELVDDLGDPIDLTTVTGTCTIWDGSVVVTTLTVTGGVGEFTISKAKAATVNLAGSGSIRRCRWGLELDNGTDSVQVWGPSKSGFTIENEDGTA